MATEILIDVDASKLSAQASLEQIEALGYATGLRGAPFPQTEPAVEKRTYRTPSDIKEIIFASNPAYAFTLRLCNVGVLMLPLSLRGAASIAAGGFLSVRYLTRWSKMW